MKIVYFVHDLADPAVARRVRMLAPVHTLILVGFRRSRAGSTQIEGRPAIEVGRTYDASFGQRLLALARVLWRRGRLRPTLVHADLLIARQLEMLMLAVVMRPPGAAIIYECLDIHRLMLGRGLAGRLLRWVERRLMQRCAGLITSSPAFITHYFEARQHVCPTPLLIENKVLRSELDPGPPATPTGPASLAATAPWRIGWFGILRCRRSLHLLAGLLHALPGQVEVVLRGRPSLTAIPDFDAIVQATPGMRFEGSYDRARDLRRIYADVHFTWCIDLFEYPGNSEWLLPNRLYEGSVFGCVPLAWSEVETGRWFRGHGCGVVLDSPLAKHLAAWFSKLDAAQYLSARASIEALNPADVICDDAACSSIVSRLDALR